MIDVDAFKIYNDCWGHVKGDQALKIVAACLQRAVRDPDDLVCRYGGEEFAVLLPASDAAAGVAVARRFRALLAETAIPHPDSTVAPVVTASIGIAFTTPRNWHNPTSADLVKAADHALYWAKDQGRDQIVVKGQNLTSGICLN
jgi:diguanylate cyclase (GGDEF)-like protein